MTKSNDSMKFPEPPLSLSQEARDIWRTIVSGWKIDAAGQLILASGLEAFDEMRLAQAILKKEGSGFQDRFGQPKAHPQTIVLRDARAAYLRTLKLLNLELQKESREDAK